MRHLLTLILVLVFSAAAMAGFTEFGAHAGIFVPTGDMSDAYEMSPMLGAQILAHFASFAIEGSASYVFLATDESLGDDASASMIPLLAGVRSYSGNLFGGGGLAVHIISFDDGTTDESESYIGAWGGVGTEIPLGSMELELLAKLHWIDFDEMGISLTAGTYF
jgi:hypothetical protein